MWNVTNISLLHTPHDVAVTKVLRHILSLQVCKFCRKLQLVIYIAEHCCRHSFVVTTAITDLIVYAYITLECYTHVFMTVGAVNVILAVVLSVGTGIDRIDVSCFIAQLHYRIRRSTRLKSSCCRAKYGYSVVLLISPCNFSRQLTLKRSNSKFSVLCSWYWHSSTTLIVISRCELRDRDWSNVCHVMCKNIQCCPVASCYPGDMM